MTGTTPVAPRPDKGVGDRSEAAFATTTVVLRRVTDFKTPSEHVTGGTATVRGSGDESKRGRAEWSAADNDGYSSRPDVQTISSKGTEVGPPAIASVDIAGDVT